MGKEDNVYCHYIHKCIYTHCKYVYIYTHTHINIYIYPTIINYPITKLEDFRKKEGQEFVGSRPFSTSSRIPRYQTQTGLYMFVYSKVSTDSFRAKQNKDVGRVFFTVFCVELSETSNVGS